VAALRGPLRRAPPELFDPAPRDRGLPLRVFLR
jgi:hypothetical protein